MSLNAEIAGIGSGIQPRRRYSLGQEIVASSEVEALEKRTRELERVVARKILENEVLREAFKGAMKKLFSRFSSSGCRRIRALMNRQRDHAGTAGINHLPAAACPA